MKSFVSCLILFFVLIGCQKTEETSGDMKMMSMEAAAPVEEVAAAAISEPRFDKIASNSPEKPIETKIIKTGNLRFETNELQVTYNQLTATVKKHSATIQNDNEGKNYESLYRNITVRVPTQHFDSFLADISKGVNYFDRKEISSQDVTEEYIDIDARLKAKKILEARYLELLKKAKKVSEMLEIETQLSAIREEIEAKEGQLRYMQSRVSMSTINIEFYKTVAAETGVTASYGTKIWNAIKSGFNGISSFFIGLLQLWPFILILVGTIYFIRKRFKKKTL